MVRRVLTQGVRVIAVALVGACALAQTPASEPALVLTEPSAT
jgi:hypothetical protein